MTLPAIPTGSPALDSYSEFIDVLVALPALWDALGVPDETAARDSLHYRQVQQQDFSEPFGVVEFFEERAERIAQGAYFRGAGQVVLYLFLPFSDSVDEAEAELTIRATASKVMWGMVDEIADDELCPLESAEIRGAAQADKEFRPVEGKTLWVAMIEFTLGEDQQIARRVE